MTSHGSGTQRGSRQGSVGSVITIPLTAAQFTTGGRCHTINASAKKPVIVEFSFYVKTAFTGSSPVILVGTSAAGTQIFADANITEGTPGFYPASNAKVKLYLTANTGIYISKTGTVSAGDGVLIIEASEVNVKTVRGLTA